MILATTIALGLALTRSDVPQQGAAQGTYQGRSLQTINQRIAVYLNGEELDSILTPGEFCEWKLDAKLGQVVIGEATSDAFDPGIQIVDDKNNVLAFNDDRYPGDQRPLLLWRCERDGAYTFRVRCFRDKSGGRVSVRFKTYDTVDLLSDQKVEKEVDARAPFLLRVPMKAGQLKEIQSDEGGAAQYMGITFNIVISPTGLPERDPSLAAPLVPAIYALVAPVTGDYYLMETPRGRRDGRGKVHVGTREVVPTKLAKEGAVATATATTNATQLWELSVKAGEFLEVSTPDLDPNCALQVCEAIDFSKFDLAKPETNPFLPLPRVPAPDPGPPVDIFPARARDGRINVFRARRDAKLWIATNGSSPANKQFAVRVRPAAADFALDNSNVGKLRIANTDYWAFDAKVGDVMTLSSTTSGFAETLIVRDPDLIEVRHTDAGLDQVSDNWRMVVQKPGRYLVAVSCVGNGGGGDYTLSRKVLSAKEFGKSSPAKGEIAEGEIQIWKFTLKPNDPQLIRWTSSNWGYRVSIYNEKGQPADFQRQLIDKNNWLGILTPAEPQTFIIVLTGGKERASYSIGLGDIPPAQKED